MPSSDGQHFLADFAATVYSSGKVSIACLRGQLLPPGVILDKNGQPSQRPADLFNGGSLLVFGGYKGYAISLLTCLTGAYTATRLHAPAKLHRGPKRVSKLSLQVLQSSRPASPHSTARSVSAAATAG